jgi:hypothetical protein
MSKRINFLPRSDGETVSRSKFSQRKRAAAGGAAAGAAARSRSPQMAEAAGVAARSRSPQRAGGAAGPRSRSPQRAGGAAAPSRSYKKAGGAAGSPPRSAGGALSSIMAEEYKKALALKTRDTVRQKQLFSALEEAESRPNVLLREIKALSPESYNIEKTTYTPESYYSSFHDKFVSPSRNYGFDVKLNVLTEFEIGQQELDEIALDIQILRNRIFEFKYEISKLQKEFKERIESEEFTEEELEDLLNIITKGKNKKKSLEIKLELKTREYSELKNDIVTQMLEHYGIRTDNSMNLVERKLKASLLQGGIELFLEVLRKIKDAGIVIKNNNLDKRTLDALLGDIFSRRTMGSSVMRSTASEAAAGAGGGSVGGRSKTVSNTGSLTLQEKEILSQNLSKSTAARAAAAQAIANRARTEAQIASKLVKDAYESVKRREKYIDASDLILRVPHVSPENEAGILRLKEAEHLVGPSLGFWTIPGSNMYNYENPREMLWDDNELEYNPDDPVQLAFATQFSKTRTDQRSRRDNTSDHALALEKERAMNELKELKDYIDGEKAKLLLDPKYNNKQEALRLDLEAIDNFGIQERIKIQVRLYQRLKRFEENLKAVKSAEKEVSRLQTEALLAASSAVELATAEVAAVAADIKAESVRRMIEQELPEERDKISSEFSSYMNNLRSRIKSSRHAVSQFVTSAMDVGKTAIEKREELAKSALAIGPMYSAYNPSTASRYGTRAELETTGYGLELGKSKVEILAQEAATRDLESIFASTIADIYRQENLVAVADAARVKAETTAAHLEDRVSALEEAEMQRDQAIKNRNILYGKNKYTQTRASQTSYNEAQDALTTVQNKVDRISKQVSEAKKATRKAARLSVIADSQLHVPVSFLGAGGNLSALPEESEYEGASATTGYGGASAANTRTPARGASAANTRTPARGRNSRKPNDGSEKRK